MPKMTFKEKIIKFVTTRGFVIALLFLALVTHLEWFNPDSTLFFNDWHHWNDIAISQMMNFAYSTWLSFDGLGSQNIQVNFFPQTFLWGLISHAELAIKLTYLWPIAILSVLAPFFLLRRYTSTPAAFLGALVYAFSTYILMRSNAHLPIAFAYSLAPFIILSFEDFLKRLTPRSFLIFLLIYSIGIFYEIRIMYILSFVLFLYYVIFISKRSFLVSLKFIFLGTLILLLIHGFWIAPTLNATESIANVANRGLWGNDYYTLRNALSFFEWKWSGGEYVQDFIAQPIKLHAWIVPLIALLSLLRFGIEGRANKKSILFFCLLLLLGLLLAKQTANPFPSLYPWLYENFPGFNLFREASKFYLLIALGYMGLFAFGIESIFIRICNSWLRVVIFTVVALILLVNAVPLLTKEIGGLFVSRMEPREYVALTGQLLSDQEYYYRTLWIPLYHQWGHYDLQRPRISYWHGLAEDEGFMKFSPLQKKLVYFQNPNFYINVFSAPYGQDVLAAMSVKYIILPKELPESSGERIFPYAGIRSSYVHALDQLSFLEKKRIGDIDIYENLRFEEHFSSFTTLNRFPSFDRLEGKYVFITKELGNSFEFVVSEGALDVPTQEVRLVFKDIDPSVISGDNISFVPPLSSTINYLYAPHAEIKIDPTQNKLAINPQQITGTTTDHYTITQLSLNTPLSLEYNLGLTPQNLVANPSFEQGSWGDKVGDCRAYDDDANFDVRFSEEGTDGSQSLELIAARHIVCVNQKVEVEGGKKYLFSFDYQSPNGKWAGYYLSFDVENPSTDKNIRFTDRFEIENSRWGEFHKVIETPQGATKGYLYFYSYPEDGKTPIITRYDDARLVQLPDDILDYYLVSDPDINFVEPESVEFEIVNPTKKLVRIEGATTPFYLAMSESYHEDWGTMINNEKVRGRFKSWVPWAKPDRVPDEHHFELNGFLNGWYIDVDKYCQEQGLCTRNPDGSYDMELVVEFRPQRWFYIGLIISGITLLGVVGFLAYDIVWRRRKGESRTVSS
jgi:hypothetical protein